MEVLLRHLLADDRGSPRSCPRTAAIRRGQVMPWFYVDDGFSDSKPVLNMPDRHRLAACGLWVLAGSWSAKEELDGFVPNSKLRQLGVRPPILAALTEP